LPGKALLALRGKDFCTLAGKAAILAVLCNAAKGRIHSAADEDIR
jgi:hypothetical protein